MRLLVISQYFWPETFRINDLVAGLTARGHEVTVLTGRPNYPDGQVFAEFAAEPEAFSRFADADVVRVPMLARGRGGLRLALNYLIFALSGIFLGPLVLRGRKFDAIFVFQPSPVTVGLPAITLGWLKQAPVAFWVLDLWPESLIAVGAVRSRPILGAIALLVRFIYRQSAVVLGQSRSFVTEIRRYLQDQRRAIYFPSWPDEAGSAETADAAPEIPPAPDLFTIVFTGNVGEAQDFPAILDAADRLRDRPVRWVIVGDGRKALWLRDEVARLGLTEQVLMPGRFPLERMPSFQRHADALLVSLRDEPIFAMTIPGKIQSYLQAGLPIIAMLNGEGAAVVGEAGAGLAVAAGHSDDLAEAVLAMIATPAAVRQEMGENGRRYASREFDRDALFDRIEVILNDISAGRIPPAHTA
ncbi:glycosyltransferase family 4 protein [Devosia ginsengisoli]|uniref:Glycosyltransferase family 4 protein n=1 Tax=Devosia ginsengisoli TaxID=400770 RepID=A0A5B8LUC3_9HYPH|nr:glycosyltransferase family 4 protein [Devosia ginsengisoli]QDZ11636.1 glycosyltransferase family 4 protein [Devosia ginsengisoli]